MADNYVEMLMLMAGDCEIHVLQDFTFRLLNNVQY